MRTPFNPTLNSFTTTHSQPLVALGFLSQSTHDLGILSIVNLCVQSYCNNLELGITGALFFDGKHFGQIMEGNRDVIEERWQVIQRDQRHDNIALISQREILHRNFTNWSMHTADADSIVLLFPELTGLVCPIQELYQEMDIVRIMDAYPTPQYMPNLSLHSLPTLH